MTSINVQKNSLRSERKCVIVCVPNYVTLRSSHQRRGFQAACSFGSLQEKLEARLRFHCEGNFKENWKPYGTDSSQYRMLCHIIIHFSPCPLFSWCLSELLREREVWREFTELCVFLAEAWDGLTCDGVGPCKSRTSRTLKT